MCLQNTDWRLFIMKIFVTITLKIIFLMGHKLKNHLYFQKENMIKKK